MKKKIQLLYLVVAFCKHTHTMETTIKELPVLPLVEKAKTGDIGAMQKLFCNAITTVNNMDLPETHRQTAWLQAKKWSQKIKTASPESITTAQAD